MTADEKRLRDSLLRAQKRRDEKFRNDRTVYSYRERSTGVLTDNMLLLPEADKAGHAAFLEQTIFKYLEENPDARLDLLDIVRIGSWNKALNTYKPCKPVLVLDLSDLKDRFNKVHKENKHE